MLLLLNLWTDKHFSMVQPRYGNMDVGQTRIKTRDNNNKKNLGLLFFRTKHLKSTFLQKQSQVISLKLNVQLLYENWYRSLNFRRVLYLASKACFSSAALVQSVPSHNVSRVPFNGYYRPRLRFKFTARKSHQHHCERPFYGHIGWVSH